MSVIFMDGFDYYNSFGGGGRKWDQSSSGGTATGRFGGQCLATLGNDVYSAGTRVTLRHSDGSIYTCGSIIVGFAMQVVDFSSIVAPFFRFSDLGVVQCSLWIDPATTQLEVRLGDGISFPPIENTILTTPFVPPLGLWIYIECKLTAGQPGSVELFVDGVSIGSATGTTQMSINPYVNQLTFDSYGAYGGGVTRGGWFADDFYVIDPTVGSGAVTDVLGEVRIQTKVPDADGYQDDWLRSQGIVNANNVNTLPVTFTDTAKFNYSGTVGAIDLYSIQNFTVTGTIFAVQENMSFKKDDVGSRSVAPILRTAAQNYAGPDMYCYSSYTYGGYIWEKNPNTSAPWELIDLNLTEFGITVTK